MEFCEPPTLGELEKRVSRARRQKTGVGALCFEQDDRKKDLVTGQRFGDLLSRLEFGIGGFSADEAGRLRAFYRELTKGEPAGRLLFTCRPDDTGLPRIKRVPLAGLARHDSLHLLTAIAGFEGFDLEREGCEVSEVEKLLDALNDHPLSISLVAPHLASLTPGDPLPGIFGGLLASLG